MAGSLFGSIVLRSPTVTRPRPMQLIEPDMPRGYEADLIALSSRQKGHHALVLGDALVQDDVNVGTAADVSSDMSTTDRGVDMTPPLVTTTGPIGTELTFNGVAKPQEEGVEPWSPARAQRFMLPQSENPLQFVGAIRKQMGKNAWEEDFMNRST